MRPQRARAPSLSRRLQRQVLRLFFSAAWNRAWRSFVAFLFGLLLAFIYGVIALYIQKHALWYCIITTLTIAAFTAFGLGLSASMRVNVALMLPMLCSKEGKKVLLILITTLIVQGPLNNIFENFDRASASVLCGAELAMNQSQQLMQRAATPLLPVLEKVREVSRNAYSLAGRVQNLIGAFTESVRHVSRSLRNVLHFLARIGDICNVKMGTPYKKCNAVFDEGRADCMELLSVFSFLCHIVDGFRPLCGVTRVGELFCVIPSYVAHHLKTKLAFPIIAAFNQMKKEFEFNMSASVHFDMNVNSSQSAHHMVQKIMEELSQYQEYILDFMGLLTYVGLFLLLFIYLQAVLYKKRYLHVDDFDNFYITDYFRKMDLRFARQGNPNVLPLTDKESLTYITHCYSPLTVREKRAIPFGMLSTLKHLLLAFEVISIDLIVFWMYDALHYHAQGEIVAKAPVIFDIQVNGSGYASDIFRDILASFDILQKENITILSKKCLMEPLEPDYTIYFFIGLLYALAFCMVFSGCYAKRLQRFVCAYYHPQREKVRILHLHSRLLSQRVSLQKAMLRAVAREKERWGNGKSLLHSLVLRLPGGVTIAKFLGLCDKSCMVCGKVVKVKNISDIYTCTTQNCTGCFCMQCFRVMGNICAVCTGPQTFQEDFEYELDSSDEEQAAEEQVDENELVDFGHPLRMRMQVPEETGNLENSPDMTDSAV